MRTKERETLAGTDPAPFLQALCGGLRSIITRHLPSYVRRLDPWLDKLLEEYKLRASRDGQAHANTWLLAELRNPRLPDLRKGKSLPDDEVLVDQYKKLKAKLAPVFRQFRRETIPRNKAAASIISRVLDHTITPEKLPHIVPLSQFCLDVLETDKVRLSRAGRRLSRQAACHVRDAMQFLQSAASSRENPQTAARAKRALDHLRRHVLPFYARRKLL